jgi:hypothetical protein
MKKPNADHRDDDDEFEGPLYPGLEGLMNKHAEAETRVDSQNIGDVERSVPITVE